MQHCKQALCLRKVNFTWFFKRSSKTKQQIRNKKTLVSPHNCRKCSQREKKDDLHLNIFHTKLLTDLLIGFKL